MQLSSSTQGFRLDNAPSVTCRLLFITFSIATLSLHAHAEPSAVLLLLLDSSHSTSTSTSIRSISLGTSAHNKLLRWGSCWASRDFFSDQNCRYCLRYWSLRLKFLEQRLTTIGPNLESAPHDVFPSLSASVMLKKILVKNEWNFLEMIGKNAPIRI